jgi:putative ABC transport system permease protein
MLKNYLKISFRNLYKNKIYSLINIAGLAVGLSVCILILTYFQFEWSFDSFHTKADQIYRVWTMRQRHGQTDLKPGAYMQLGSELQANLPGIDATTRLYAFDVLAKTSSEEKGHPEEVMMVDPSFFNIFDFKLIKGNKNTVFSNPKSLVLTPEMAHRFFGEGDPLQQSLFLKIGDQYEDFVVTGIIKNAPVNSSLQYNMLIPFANAKDLFPDYMTHNLAFVSSATYVLLHKGIHPEQLKGKLDDMMRQELGEDYTSGRYTIGFQPLKDIHLDTRFPQGFAKVSNPTYAYILAIIALLVLAIACINFITLAISQTASRAKEVGIRKTIGAERKDLIFQLLGDAFLTTVFSIVVGVALSELFRPLFYRLTEVALPLDFSYVRLLSLIGLTIFVSLIIGIYPALELSGLHPVEILRGKLMISGNRGHFYQVMVIFQFTISIVLIIATVIVHNQMNFVRTTNLGYNKDELVVFPSGFESGSKPGKTSPIDNEMVDASRVRRQLLETKLESFRGIQEVSASSYSPVQISGWYRGFFEDNQGQQQEFHFNIIDTHFLTTMGIKLVEGRDFSDSSLSSQQNGIIVNQALVQHFGWKHPLGMRLPGPGFENQSVIGVTEDFHYQSLYTPVEPLVLAMNPQLVLNGIDGIRMDTPPSPRYTIKMHTDNIPTAMNELRKVWSEVAPGVPFNYTFVDVALDQQYRQSQRFSDIVVIGSALAIFLACLGLFGLTSLNTVRRTKEIGIRKVFGATVTGVVAMLSKDFLKLVLIGFAFAIPISWYAMNLWLQNFAYHIHIGIWAFLLAGALAMLIALITVSWQSIKTALANPVDALRNE